MLRIRLVSIVLAGLLAACGASTAADQDTGGGTPASTPDSGSVDRGY